MIEMNRLPEVSFSTLLDILFLAECMIMMQAVKWTDKEMDVMMMKLKQIPDLDVCSLATIVGMKSCFEVSSIQRSCVQFLMLRPLFDL